MLHLHRFHHRNWLSALNEVADADIDTHHGARKCHADDLSAFGQRYFVLRRHGPHVALAVRQNRKRIEGIDLGGRNGCVRGLAV